MEQICHGEVNCAVPGMIDFWPMNIQYEGQNLMSNGGDFALNNVQYDDDDGIWKFPPAYFPSDGKGYFSSSEFNFRQQDFSWMTAYKQEASSWGNGAIAFTLSFGAFDMTFMYDGIRIYLGGIVEIPLSLNVWHTLAFVASGDTITFYADGNVVGTKRFSKRVSSIKINYDE